MEKDKGAEQKCGERVEKGCLNNLMEPSDNGKEKIERKGKENLHVARLLLP